jgi:catechol 2,3-dioxygenase-like lactoylglutathione lyase family enzyme
MKKPKLVGINHVALAVGDIDKALAFWRAIFDFEIQEEGDGMAFLDMGDQFIALMESDEPVADRERHFGLVVDDRTDVLALAEAAGATIVKDQRVDFLDPWGNRIQMVEYRDIQFSKTASVLNAMGVDGAKSPSALDELKEKGMTP